MIPRLSVILCQSQWLKLSAKLRSYKHVLLLSEGIELTHYLHITKRIKQQIFLMIFERLLECGILVRNDVTDGVWSGAWSLVLIRQSKYMSSGVNDLIDISVIDDNREPDIFYLKFISTNSYFNNSNVSDERVKVF